jgi:hypothetical protein
MPSEWKVVKPAEVASSLLRAVVASFLCALSIYYLWLFASNIYALQGRLLEEQIQAKAIHVQHWNTACSAKSREEVGRVRL